MNIDLAIKIATPVSTVIGIITLIFVIISYRRQMNAHTFLEYTNRFEKIMESFPRSSWSARLNLYGPLPATSEELSLCALQYLNLCSEEFYLHKRGYLAKDVWQIWEGEMRR